MKKTLLIIGAGCSAGSASLPTDKDFLYQKYSEIEKEYFLKKGIDKLYPFGGANPDVLVEHWRQYRLEIVWSEIDANYNSPKFILKPNEIEEIYSTLKRLAEEELRGNLESKYYSVYQYQDPTNRTPYQYLFMFAGWELKKIIYKTYTQILKEEQKKLYEKLIEFCVRESDCVEIISFNYDTLIEQALERYHYEVIDNPKKDGIKIIKPHGSVNWLQIDKPSNQSQNIISCDKPLDLIHMGYKETGFFQPALVGLIDRKPEYEIDRGIYKSLGIAIEHSLMDADRVVVVGYSFPSGDRHIKGILKEAKVQMKFHNKPPLKRITAVCYLDELSKKDMEEDLVRLFYVDKNNIDVIPQKWQEWIGC